MPKGFPNRKKVAATPASHDIYSQEELSKIYYAKLRDNELLFGFTFCGDHFRDASAPFHYKLFVEAGKHNRFAVAAPRDSAKTTVLSFLKPLHSAVFKRKHFIVLIGATQSKADEKLEAINKFLKSSAPMTEQFKIEMVKDSATEIQLRHPDGFEVKISTFGRDQMPKIRGAKFGAYRPDLVIIDDLEDDKQVENPLLREEVRKHFEDAVLKSIDSVTGTCIVIGTILHDDCLIGRLVSLSYYKNWRKLLYKALFKHTDGKEYSLWPKRKGWSVEELCEERMLNPRTFAKEKQNDPVSGTMARFKQSQFKYWEVRDGEALLYEKGIVVAKHPLSSCRAAVACDLAWEEKRENDYSVIMPGFLTPDADILIDLYTCKKGMRPHELQGILFSLVERLEILTRSKVPVGFEKAQNEKVQKYLLKNEMRARNKFLMFKDLAWDGDKIKRAEMRLEPRYNQGVVYHKKGMNDLEYQLTRFPSGAHDDLVDAAQGLVQLLQFPKKPRKAAPEDDEFMRVRKFAIDIKRRKRGTGRFNMGRKRFSVPAIVSPLGM